MDWRKQAYLQHQQQRWLCPDAARWVRPDAAKFLKSGTRAADVYPALDRKYSPSQPRVPAGNGRPSGRWSDASYGNGDRPRVYITARRDDDEIGDGGDGGLGISLTMGSIDFGDIGSEVDKLDLFDIKPRERPTGGVRLAGDPPQRLPAIIVTPDKHSEIGTPGIGHNQGPPLDELPAIPTQLPETRAGRMNFVRSAASILGVIGRQAPIVSAYLGLLDQLDYLKIQTDMIRTANDPPRTLDELQRQIGKPGYQRHHIAEEAAARDAKNPENLIQGFENLVGVPTLKHIDISKYYSTKTKREDGTWRSPRDDLKDADFAMRKKFGLTILRKYGVLN